MSKKNELPTLFTLANSKIFLEMVRIINHIQDSGQSLSYKEILKQLQNVYRDGISSQEGTLFPEVLKYYLGITKEEMADKRWRDKLVNLPIKAGVPIRATNRELHWLKNMLQDSDTNFLLHDELRKKILTNINNYFHTTGMEKSAELDYNDFWSPNYVRPEATRTPEFLNKLNTIWQAIVSHRKIRYINSTPNGEWKGVEAPCRLEFDFAYGTYNLIIWPDKEKRPVKMHVDRLKLVEITNESFEENIINDAFKKSLAEKKEVAHLQLLDKKKTNALSRFYTRFEGYDKDSHQDDIDKNLYHVYLHYYRFDKNDVLHGLMSLGNLVQVISPQSLRDEIIKKYQLAAERLDKLLLCNSTN